MRSELGKLGENMAAKYWQSLGYRIIERNFRTKYGEIDMIGMDGRTLVFAEVKTKTGTEFGIPEEMFDRTKLSKVRRMAQIYLEGKERLCRIDMIAITVSKEGKVTSLRHHKCVT